MLNMFASNNIHDVSGVDFGIYSADEIRGMAVCKIDNTKDSEGMGTVYDKRMGCTNDRNEQCPTCGLQKECWGHFGYIDLAEPVLHPMYLKYISAFLKCFCKQCHKLLLSEEQMMLKKLYKSVKDDKSFVRVVKELEKIDMCTHCSSPQPKIIYKSKDGTINLEYKQKKMKESTKVSIPISVDEIKKIFDDISDRDTEIIGFNPKRSHPRNLILTVFPVIPPCSRPYVKMDGNICDDDLTYQLLEIVKLNNKLSNSELSTTDRDNHTRHLRFRISTMINNSKNKAKHPTDGRPLKGIKERLAGKGGRIRNNLMGK